MRNVLLLIVVLVGCGSDAGDEVSCETFTNAGYRSTSTDQCVFDVSGIDWSRLDAPPAPTTPFVIGSHPNPFFGDVSVVDEAAEIFSATAITWDGDTEQGEAVMVGELGPNGEITDTCVWVRCTSVEPQL